MNSSSKQIQLYWTKDAFSLNYTIFKGAEIVGIIKDNSLSRSVKASIFGEKYLFESEGFLRARIDIIHLGSKEVVGGIKAKIIKPQAILYYSCQLPQKLDQLKVECSG